MAYLVTADDWNKLVDNFDVLNDPVEYSYQGAFSAFAIGVEEAGRSMANFAKAVNGFNACPYCDTTQRPIETLPGNRHCPECKGFR